MMSKMTLRAILLGSCAAALIAVASPAAAQADPVTFDIPSQPLGAALNQFAQQSKIEILFSSQVARDLNSPAIQGKMEPREALAMLLAQSGLSYRATPTGSFVIEAADPQSGSAAGDGADGTVQALIVTAQKREEQIQDVPIAISAFTEKSLQEQKIEGGFDLLKAIPNVTFSKNNFSSYNFSIRGIGTKAISVTTDPGVAVEFNASPLIRNRLFEQEYFDVERVEVLRGPQGTLHGRNATAGVINVISAKPDMDEFNGWLRGEVGNYHSKRLSAMVNVPLVEDKLAIRFAGSLTDRAGYDFNRRTGHAINGRDLWSGRVTIGFKPTESLRANLVWERFNEDDNRSRTGKQLCHHDDGPTSIGGYDLAGSSAGIYAMASFSQGCRPGSLYDDGAFGTPNGLSMPFVLAGADPQAALGFKADGTPVSMMAPVDPYGDMMQSPDLRVVDSIRDPVYRARADVVEMNVDFDLTENLTLSSQTVYDKDTVYSFQDYNRFNTVPIFNDTSGLIGCTQLCPDQSAPSPFQSLLAGGIYCDPQIGCADSIAGFDISQAKSRQFGQELRIQSNFPGHFNFSAGANYTKYTTVEDYYVLFNLITLLAQSNSILGVFNGSADIGMCQQRQNRYLEGRILGFPNYGNPTLVSMDDPVASQGCIYIDPNPVESIGGDGHNYFRSKNPYRLTSGAVFGEVYWDVTDVLKVTAGLRYTDDRKAFTPVPSQVLLSSSYLLQGTVDRGYPELPDIKQHWGEFSGRLGVDWKPDLSFTNQTLIYAFYSRGYKGGGANPPGIGFNTAPCTIFGSDHPCTQTLPYPLTFQPEFVNAYEVGSKNTLLGGALVLNGDVFFYDYKDYQVSQIKDRTAVNENFDATVWGAELEGFFQPTRDLRFNFAMGYQGSKIADGEKSIDLMDRLQGTPGYHVVKPFVQLASNCVASDQFILEALNSFGPASICPGFIFANFFGIDYSDPVALPNGGAGFFDDLSGNELPNAPHWTMSVGAQYGWQFMEGWKATVRGDAYWQAQSWARVYNSDPYDKLHGWYNVNLSAWIENQDGLKIEFYAKNLLDKTPITDAFLNSDDTALTTNVFVLDPRLLGLSIKKDF